MNGKIFLICGKVCSGKSTLAALLRASENAVVLSCDEVVFSLFGEDFGERHEEVTNRVKKYLCKKAAEIAHMGGNVILDWGFGREPKGSICADFSRSARYARCFITSM